MSRAGSAVTSPIRVPCSSQRSKMRSTSRSRPGRGMTSIRSWDSDSMTSYGVMSCARRHERHVDTHADTAFGGDLTRRASESRRAKVLERFHRIGFDQLERGFKQKLFEEGIAHLDRRAFGVRTGAELERRQERGARDPVAAGVAPYEVHRTARSRAAC